LLPEDFKDDEVLDRIELFDDDDAWLTDDLLDESRIDVVVGTEEEVLGDDASIKEDDSEYDGFLPWMRFVDCGVWVKDDLQDDSNTDDICGLSIDVLSDDRCEREEDA